MKSVFVSSTFKDMHFERDVLHGEIRPKLNLLLSAYNSAVRISDLRWGIDTTELSEEKACERIISMCYNEIEKCKPYFIVFLGDRYGYTPQEYGKSITHLEIIRGVLNAVDINRVFIYFRKADYTGLPEELRGVYFDSDENSRQKLNSLKKELSEKFPDRCREYESRWSKSEQAMVSDSLADLVYGDLAELFSKEYADRHYYSELQKQIEENEQTLAENISLSFQCREKLEKDADDIENSAKTFGIIGEAGAGKSVYSSQLCSLLRQRGRSAFIMFCGDDPFSANVRNIAEFVLYALTVSDGLPYDFAEHASRSYDEILRLLAEKNTENGKTFVILDAIDQCEEGAIDFIRWVNGYLPSRVRIVFSSRKSELLQKLRPYTEFSEMQYGKEELRSILVCILKIQCKELSAPIIEEIVSRLDSPLKISLLVLRLLSLKAADYDEINRVGGGIDAINARLLEIVKTSATDAAVLADDYLFTLFEDSANPAFSQTLLNLIAFSDYGIPESDLQGLIGFLEQRWVQVDYMDFLAKFSFFIRIRENGRVDISHDVIRKAIRLIFADTGSSCSFVLAAYYLNKDSHDALSFRTFFGAVQNCKENGLLISFVMKNKELVLERTDEKAVITAEFQKNMQRMFLRDGGKFVFHEVMFCRNIEEVLIMQQTIISALMRIDDYIDGDAALSLADAMLKIPLGISEYPADLAELAILECETFLKRHKVDEKRKDEFLNFRRQILTDKKTLISADVPCHDGKDRTVSALEELSAENTPVNRKIELLIGLAKTAREMANDPKKCEKAESILLTLLKSDLRNSLFENDREMENVILADIYTSLGVLYKTKKQWSDALEYDRKSLEIYKNFYESAQTSEMFRKYRERVYNVANVLEAWAIAEDRAELWQKTCDAYKKCYELDMLAVGKGVSERELFYCADSVMSYGTSLIRAGRKSEGVDKYDKGISLMLELCSDDNRNGVCLRFCVRLMEIVCNLAGCGMYGEAVEVFGRLNRLTEKTALSSDRSHSFELMWYAEEFYKRINGILNRLFAEKDMTAVLNFSRSVLDFYTALLPIATEDIRANVVIMQNNIADMYFLRFKNWEQALTEYGKLHNLLQDENFWLKQEDGKYNDEFSFRFADSYARRFICLHNLGRKEEINERLKDVGSWAKFFAAHTESYSDDPAYILYVTGTTLAGRVKSLGLAVLQSALAVTAEENYDKEKHSGTVLSILFALSQLQKNSDSDSE